MHRREETCLETAASLFRSGRLPEARAHLARFLKREPLSVPALQFMGVVSSELGRHGDAVRHLQRAARLAPSSPAVQLNLGKALQAAGRLDEALAAFSVAVRLAPDIANVHAAYGGALALAKRLDEAAKHYQEVIRLSPASADGYYNIAKVLFALGRHAAALAAWEQVEQREPKQPEPVLRISQCKQELCDWQDYDGRITALRTQLAQMSASDAAGLHGAAFLSLVLWDDGAFHKRCAEIEAAARPEASLPGPLKRRAQPQIRLAYVSADFKQHATAKLASGLFEAHDRTRFEVTAVTLNADDGSSDHRRLTQAFDQWVDAHSIDGAAIVQRMRDLHIDIAVDLKGYTKDAKPEIFIGRAAPIQVNFLGHPGTMAIPSMDYIVVDPFIAAGDIGGTAAEKLVILPDCYQVNDSKRPPVGRAPSRSACGLPETGFVFASLNQQRKITPVVFNIWMRILRRVAGSVLWLIDDLEPGVAARVSENLRREASTRGVAPERLFFAGRAPSEQHLARIACADLHLDTFPYGSHTTASDALWAGAPILTMAGTSFASRVCGSLLTTIGVPELVTTSWVDYEELAVRLAQDRELLARYRARIAEGRAISPLFDTGKFCRNLEAAYEEMVRIALAGGQPQEIDVRSLA